MQQPNFIPQSTPIWAADDYQIYLIVAWRVDGPSTLNPVGVCAGIGQPADLEEGADGDGDVILFIDRNDAEEHVDRKEKERMLVKPT
jgi:hypothetical protein